jgi:hypothetical protein
MLEENLAGSLRPGDRPWGKPWGKPWDKPKLMRRLDLSTAWIVTRTESPGQKTSLELFFT